MKIRVNLARPEKFAERAVFLWAPPLALIGAALLVFLIFSSARSFIEYRKADRAVIRYQAEVGEIQAQRARVDALLHRPDTLKLYSQINFLNSLIEQKKLSLSGLTLDVAKLLPEQARITGLGLAETARGPVVQISVEGSADVVTGAFLSNLEASPEFDGVTVIDQSFGADNQPSNDVLLTCSARYIGPRAPGREADAKP